MVILALCVAFPSHGMDGVALYDYFIPTGFYLLENVS